jgi:hypothetical protein
MAVEDVGNLRKVLKEKGYSKKATDEVVKWYE